MFDYGFNPIGAHTTDTTVSSATTITPTAGAGITKVLIQAVTQNVRFVLDGTTPTASVGFQLKAGDPPMIIPVKSGQTIILIEETASAVVCWQFGN